MSPKVSLKSHFASTDRSLACRSTRFAISSVHPEVGRGLGLDFGGWRTAPKVAGVGTPPPEALAVDPRPRELQNRNPHPETDSIWPHASLLVTIKKHPCAGGS